MLLLRSLSLYDALFEGWLLPTSVQHCLHANQNSRVTYRPAADTTFRHGTTSAAVAHADRLAVGCFWDASGMVRSLAIFSGRPAVAQLT